MASVAKFKLNEAPRLLTHCSRTQKTPGSHIHQERTCLNFNMAAGRHEGVSDYEFVKDKIHQDDVRMLKRDDVKTVHRRGDFRELYRRLDWIFLLIHEEKDLELIVFRLMIRWSSMWK